MNSDQLSGPPNARTLRLPSGRHIGWAEYGVPDGRPVFGIFGASARFFRRQKYDAARTLAAFGAQARDVVALEQLSDQLLRAVDQTMQPAHTALWLKPARKDSP